jgi:hypothetical protein
VVSPVLFGALMDWLLGVALDGLGEDVGVAVGRGERLVDLDFADDVLLLAASVRGAEVAVAAVEAVGERVGLKLNPRKTVWVAGPGVLGTEMRVAGVSVARAESLVYLGSEMNWGGGLAGEV